MTRGKERIGQERAGLTEGETEEWRDGEHPRQTGKEAMQTEKKGGVETDGRAPAGWTEGGDDLES